MKLRIGVVGAGTIARESHLPVLKSLENVEVVAICDKRISAAKEMASQFGIKAIFVILAEMLYKEKLDAVDICTPPYTHAPLSIQAMEAGCHVLVEKPMVTNVKETDEMIRVAKRTGVKPCSVHQNLLNPAVVKARRLVEEGTLGNFINVIVQTFEPNNGYICSNQHTDHKEFCELNLAQIKPLMKENPIIIDGKRVISPTIAKNVGFEYVSLSCVLDGDKSFC